MPLHSLDVPGRCEATMDLAVLSSTSASDDRTINPRRNPEACGICTTDSELSCNIRRPQSGGG